MIMDVIKNRNFSGPDLESAPTEKAMQVWF